MGRTCGEPDEIGLTAMGVELNGSGRVHHRAGLRRGRFVAWPRTAPTANEARRSASATAVLLFVCAKVGVVGVVDTLVDRSEQGGPQQQ